MFRIILSKKSEKALKQLPEEIRSRVINALDDLANQPRPHGSRKLKDRDAWRIRIGDYRVVYTIQDQKLVVIVIKVAHRREAYRT